MNNIPIKFRAWDKTNKRWIYFELIKDDAFCCLENGKQTGESLQGLDLSE